MATTITPIQTKECLENLKTLLAHDEVNCTLNKHKLSDQQLSVLNAVTEFNPDAGLPDNINNMDVVKLSRHFKKRDVIGPASAIGRTLTEFAAEVLKEPAVFCEYGEYGEYGKSLKPVYHGEHYNSSQEYWFQKAVDAGDVKALYELGLSQWRQNPQEALEAFKLFVNKARESKQFKNNDGYFSGINPFLITFTYENLFNIYFNDYEENSDPLAAKEVKKYAASYMQATKEFETPKCREVVLKLGWFANEIYNADNDDEGVKLFLQNNADIDSYHNEGKHEVLKILYDLDKKTNNAITNILEKDNSEEFDALKTAYGDYLKQNLPSPKPPSPV